MKTFLISILFLTLVSAHGQNGWNWPEDEKNFKTAQDKQAYYKVLMGMDKYAEALVELQWLYDNNPNLNPSIYIEGSQCVEQLIKATDDKTQLAELHEKSLWMYDQRIQHFGNAASVLDRQAYTAFKYYYKTPDKYPKLFELYEKAFEANGVGISNFNIVPYMTVAKYGYDWKVETATKSKVLDIHSKISGVIEGKQKVGEDMKEYQDKVDALFSSLDGLLTCDFIENSLVPRFSQNPDDLGTAKKIVAYSLEAKCSDKAYFLEAGEAVLKKEPSYKFYKIIADKRLARNEFTKAAELYEKAYVLAENNQDKYDILITQARMASRNKQRAKARDLALKAIQVRPGDSDAYSLIGDQYMLSFELCAEKNNIVLDRAIFIAAYEMYNQAGNQEGMKNAKKQFPSKEEIFSNNMQAGDAVQVGCWIQKQVKIDSRD